MHILRALLIGAVTGVLIASGSAEAASAIPSKTLKEVRKRGELRCGITPTAGPNRDNEIAICNALAAAVTTPENAVTATYVDAPTAGGVRFSLLLNYDIDVLVRGSNSSIARQGTSIDGVTFGRAWLYQPQGIHTFHEGLKEALSVATTIPDIVNALNNSGVKICAQGSNIGLLNTIGVTNPVLGGLTEYIVTSNPICNTLVHSFLAGESARTDDMTFAVPQLRSVDFYLAYHDDDVTWGKIVNATFDALVRAAQYGVKKGEAGYPHLAYELQTLFGAPNGTQSGSFLGLAAAWAINAVNAEGNYLEIIEPDTFSSIYMRTVNRPHLDVNGNLTGGLHVPDSFEAF